MKIGVFEILETLGGGGSGTVYRARNETLGRIVAVKQLHRHVREGDQIFERFHREAQLMASIRSDHVVTLYSYQIVDGKPLLEMECLQHSLERRMNQGPLDFHHVLQIVREILLGLNALHTAGIVHRDVKPANVLEDEAGRLKLTDFGLSVLDSDTKLTMEAATIRYVAPESMFESATFDFRSDLYSTGMMAYEAILGADGFQDAFPDLMPAAAFATKWLGWVMDRTDEAAPLHVLRPDVPLPVSQFVARLMAKDPELRYASADAALDALRPLVQAPRERVRERPTSVGRESVERGTASSPEVRGQRSSLLRVIGLAAACLVVAIGAIVVGAPLRRTLLQPPQPNTSTATKEVPGHRVLRQLVASVADENGTRLSNVAFKLLPGKVTGRSDQEGTYLFRALEPGSYELTATLTGHETVVRNVTIASDADARETVTLRVVAGAAPPHVVNRDPNAKTAKKEPSGGGSQRPSVRSLFYGTAAPPKPPAVQASNTAPGLADKSSGVVLNTGLKYKIVALLPTGKEVEVDPDMTFHSGDRVRFVFESNIDGYLYLVQRGSSGRWTVLFPSPQINTGANSVSRSLEYAVPASGWFKFDAQPGTEELLVMLSKEPVPQLPGFDKVVTRGETVAQSAVDEIVRSIKSRDLLFEKSGSTEIPNAGAPQTQQTFVVNRGQLGQAVVARVHLAHR